MYRVGVRKRRAVSDDVVKQNMERCADLPVYATPGLESGSVAICAAGPSLLGEIETIRTLHRIGVPICAVKGVTDILIEHGIVPKYAVFMDAKEDQARFLTNPHPDIEYLICSQSHPAVFAALEGFKVTVWHGQCQSFAQYIVDTSAKPATYIHGPTTGAAAINLMRSMGYGPLNLFGYDCSFVEQSHVYDRDDSKTLTVKVNKRPFKTTLPMVDQHNFLIWLFIVASLDVRVYGDSALQESVRVIESAPMTSPDDYSMMVDAPLDGFEEKDLV